MIGVLGGLGLVGLLPDHWGWSLSLLIASSPLLLILAVVPSIRRRFPDASMAATPASRTPDAGRADRMSLTLWTMFAVGIVLALAWSAVSQFLLPLRGRASSAWTGAASRLCSCSLSSWTWWRCFPWGGSPTGWGAPPSSAS
jgi:hypothetical protein